MSDRSKSPRQRLLAAIHIAKKERGLSDDDYRDLLERETGKRSAKEIGSAGLGQVLDALKGKKPGAKRRPRKQVGEGKAPLIAKIDAQLAELGKDRSYANSILKRMTARQPVPCERVEFADPGQLRKVVSALYYRINPGARARKSKRPSKGGSKPC